MWDQNENHNLDTSVSYKKDNPLLKLTLQKKYLKIRNLNILSMKYAQTNKNIHIHTNTQ